MISVLKKGWTFIFAIFSLMVAPQEKLRFVLEDEPSYWYGELALKGPAGTYILAKNGNQDAVDPDLPGAKPLAAASLRRSRSGFSPTKEVRPRSYALFLVDNGKPLPAERQARDKNGESFRFEPLRVQADAESGIASWILILIAFLLSVLGCAIGYSFSGDIDSLVDTKE